MWMKNKSPFAIILFSLAVGAGCASDRKSSDGVTAIIEHDWDASSDAASVSDPPDAGLSVGQEDAGADTDIVMVPCEPSFGTTFDVGVGVPVFVGAKFIDVLQDGSEKVMHHGVVRTQVNEDFQMTFNPEFQDVDFTFDSLLKVDVGEDGVVRLTGEIASQEDGGEIKNVAVFECVKSFGDAASYQFDPGSHQVHVQFYVSKDPP